MEPLDVGIREIAQAIRHGRGRFALGPTLEGPRLEGVGLSVGAPRAVQVDGGFIVTIKLTRAHLEALRDLCNQALESPF